MARSRSTRGHYTPMGKRIAKFGPQYKIAKLLGFSQQTVSKKLRGECVISVPDLEKLARRLKVPIGIFFSPGDQACAWVCACGQTMIHSYAALTAVGNPICSKCDHEMDLVG